MIVIVSFIDGKSIPWSLARRLNDGSEARACLHLGQVVLGHVAFSAAVLGRGEPPTVIGLQHEQITKTGE